MEEKKKTLLLVLVLTLCLLISGVLYQNLTGRFGQGGALQKVQEQGQRGQVEDAQEAIKMAAPDFSVVDEFGEQRLLSDYRGKPVVLNFWASWCSICRSEMGHFEAAYGEFGDQVQFMMVNLTDGDRETPELAAAVLAEGSYTFPVYYDLELEAGMAYGVNGIPVTYFIDAEGNLVAQAKGALDEAGLSEGIGLLLPEGAGT